MYQDTTRKFTIRDALALVTATAVGLWLTRILSGRAFSQGDVSWSCMEGSRPLALALMCLLAALGVYDRVRFGSNAACLSAGVAACVAVVITSCIHLISWLDSIIDAVRAYGIDSVNPAFWGNVVSSITRSSSGAASILAIWLVLKLSGSWHVTRNWIDITGLTLALYWSVLFSCVNVYRTLW